MKRTTAFGLISVIAATFACEEVVAERPVVGRALGASPQGSLQGLPQQSPEPSFAERLTVHLVKTVDNVTVVSFGVPVPPSVHLSNVSSIRVAAHKSGAVIAANIRETLATHDASGTRTGVRAVVVQIPALSDDVDVDIIWRGQNGTAPGRKLVAFADESVSRASDSAVNTAVRTISSSGGVNTLIET